MGTLRHPAGPLPEKVYWVRRAIVLAAVVVVLALVMLLVSKIGSVGASDGEQQGSGSAATPTATDGGSADDAQTPAQEDAGDAAAGDAATEEAAEAAAAEPAADTGTPRECTGEDLALNLAADGTTFAAGHDPTFTLEVTSVAADPCLVDVTDATRQLVIVSGPAHVWSSAECVQPEPRLLLLSPGQVDSAAITWNRNRTDAACTPGLPAATAGTYRATVTLLGAQTPELVFVLG